MNIRVWIGLFKSALKNVHSLLSVVFLMLSMFAYAEEKSKAIEEVISVEYPPFTSAELVGGGVLHQLLDKYSQRHLHVQPRPLFLPPARAQKVILNGQWCLSFYPPSIGNKQVKFVPLREQNVQLGLYRIRQAEDFVWQSIAELAGQRLALLRTYAAQTALSEPLSEAGFTLVSVETIEQGVRLLLQGKVDYAFGDNISVPQLPLTDAEKQQLQFSKTVLQSFPVGFYYHLSCEKVLFRQDQP